MNLQISNGFYHFRVLLVMIIFNQIKPGSLTDNNCADRLIGVENRYVIPDSSFTATSKYDSSYNPYHARLNSNLKGWCARTRSDPNDYLQINLGLPYVICAVATQGSSDGSAEWVTQYKISLSMDGSRWNTYQEGGVHKLFAGNTDYSTIIKHTLAQPLVRYIRFIPSASRWKWRTMRVGIYGYFKACENSPLGMESGAIQDGSITASSDVHLAKNARLHYTSGSSWCASTSDSDPYLQIDLGTSHLICAVATQGNSIADQWVKTYQIDTWNSATWTTYQENNIDRVFYGNYDRSTAARRILYHGIITRYLRIVPKTSQTGTPCLRTEIYGYPFQTSCSSHSVGIPSTSLVPDHRFTATSTSAAYKPFKGRLGNSQAWAAYTRNAPDDYLQIDLGAMFDICAVATQGLGENRDEYVKKYQVLYSTNNVQWTTYQEMSGDKEFSGNSDRSSVVTNAITNPFRARFVRVLPTEFKQWKMLRVDFKGLPLGCTSPLGLENSQIPDSQMTSSSFWTGNGVQYTARLGRLYGSSSWCSQTNGNNEYIQVNLGQVKTVTGIATQGNPHMNAWVKSYKVSYSFDNRYWNEYKEGLVVKNLEGNSDRNGVRVNWFRNPTAARHIRIIPQTHNSGGGHCLRFDVYGCDIFVAPKISLNDLILPSIKGSSITLTCSVLGEPAPDIQWFNNGTKINGATQSTLQVQFISAEDVMSKYNCTRQDPNTRAVVCNTFYTCRATYPNYVPSGGMNEASGKVTVNLNVPEPPTFSGTASERSITLSWIAPTPTDDAGQITWYGIKLKNQSSNPLIYVRGTSSSYNLAYLKPHTNYSVEMRAISVVGYGLWSSLQVIRTSIAKPTGVPVITGLVPKSSQSIQVNWEFTEHDTLYGPLDGYTIKYAPRGGVSQTARVNGDVKTTTLTSLEKYTWYTVTVLVRNTLYDGPESKASSKRTLEDAPSCSPTLLTAKATTSTSIVVTWTPLSANTKCLNGVVREYKVYYRKTRGGPSNSPISVDEFTSSKEISGLDKYTRYEFEVLARTVGDGPRSNALQETTNQDAPSNPVNPEALVLDPGSNIRVPRVRITWEKPQEENGIITRYVIYYSLTGTGVSIYKYINITDINTLSYTMSVPGETKFSFSIKASTIKDGPYTASENGDVPSYPPAIAPRNTRSIKLNKTTFSIAWQPLPRDQSNGVVTKYEVTWQLMSIGNRRRRSLSPSVTASTQDSQYTIYKLRLCAQYTVYVKGFTKAGPGPNSTVLIVTSQPGEPLNVRPAGKGKRTIELKWDKPRGVSREIRKYKIIMKGFKPYWKNWGNVSKEFEQKGEQANNKNFQNLQPGTSYEFWVISITECGESNKSVSTSVSTDVDVPVQPEGKPVDLPQDSFNVTLWPVKPENGPISSYHVIVVRGKSTNVDTLPDDIHNYEDAIEKKQEYYIAAKIKVDDFKSIPKQFTVGDDKVYGGYRNVPLKKGETYTIAERAVTVDNKKVYIGKAAKIATIHLKAESKGEEPVSSPVPGQAIGGAFGFLVLLACVALGFFLYRRKHGKAKDDYRESDMALDDIEDNEQQERESVGTIDSQEEPNKYVNVLHTESANEEIYDQTWDNAAKPIPVRQFAEYVKTAKSTDYARIKEEFKHLPNAHLFSTSVAKNPENKKKNRYGNIVTYNHSRVVIERTGDENSDYINASYMDGFDGTPKVYIASQGPVPRTFPDFWQMIWEQNTCTIVMLTNLVEGGKTKCHEYWPENKETYREITVNHHKTEVFPDYIIRTFLLTKANSQEQRNILHFQFTVWPDKGVPHYATAVLGLRRKVKALNPQNAGPVLVHCSAGVGRTGAYIVIDAMLDRTKKLRNIEICNYVAKIRKARPYMVQTDEQYVFIHLAVLEVLTCGNTEIQAHNLQNVMKKLSTINPQKQISGFAAEFERLNLVTADYVEDECDIGQAAENASKNRYPDVIALNSCRVLLTKEDATETDSVYINASFNHAYRERNAFILTQAPLQNTIEDFWIMVVNYDIKTIVMLNTLEEENEQFPQYWPQTEAETYGNVTVELLSSQDIGELVSRRFKVTYKSSSIRVQHLQHLKWADKCIPANPQTVLDLLNEVEQSQRQSSNATPVVVQCSNGVGRSGTFCTISSILERMKQEQVIDVFQVVKCMRSNRPGAVESLTQYIFCYQIIQKYLDSFSDYANFSNS